MGAYHAWSNRVRPSVRSYIESVGHGPGRTFVAFPYFIFFLSCDMFCFPALISFTSRHSLVMLDIVVDSRENGLSVRVERAAARAPIASILRDGVRRLLDQSFADCPFHSCVAVTR